MGFSIEAEDSGGRRFRLVGELDLASSPALQETLSPLAESEGDLHLDLSRLEFIDSSGIRAILVLAEALGKRGRLILVGPSKPVDRTLRLVGIDRAENLEIRAAKG